jgi:hypothetical protein
MARSILFSLLFLFAGCRRESLRRRRSLRSRFLGWWSFRGSRSLGTELLVLPGIPHGQVFPHLVEFLWAHAPDRLQIIQALECAIRFSSLKDFFFAVEGPDTRHLLQFLGVGGIQVDRVQRRFLLCRQILGRPEH